MLPGGTFSNKYASELAVIRTKTQWVWLLAAMAFFIVAIPSFASDYWLTQFTNISVTMIIVMGMHILSGLCGLISIGQAAFSAGGAYVTAILISQYDVNGWLCLPAAILAGGIWGIFFGLPTFRLKGIYLAVVTLASFKITIWLIGYRDFWPVTGGFTGIGISQHPLSIFGYDLTTDKGIYILGVVMVAISAYLALNIQRSNTGRIFVAIRDNELAAEVSGIGIYRNKLIAFFIGCSFAGAAGWLMAYSQGRVMPSQFNFDDSIWYIGAIIIGGWGKLSGVFLGGGFLEFMDVINNDYLAPWLEDVLPDRWSAQIRVALKFIMGGLSIIMFLKYVPTGLATVWEKFKLFYRIHPYSSWHA